MGAKRAHKVTLRERFLTNVNFRESRVIWQSACASQVAYSPATCGVYLLPVTVHHIAPHCTSLFPRTLSFARLFVCLSVCCNLSDNTRCCAGERRLTHARSTAFIAPQSYAHTHTHTHTHTCILIYTHACTSIYCIHAQAYISSCHHGQPSHAPVRRRPRHSLCAHRDGVVQFHMRCWVTCGNMPLRMHMPRRYLLCISELITAKFTLLPRQAT